MNRAHLLSLLNVQKDLIESLFNDYDSLENIKQLRARQRTITEFGNTILDLLEDDTDG